MSQDSDETVLTIIPVVPLDRVHELIRLQQVLASIMPAWLELNPLQCGGRPIITKEVVTDPDTGLTYERIKHFGLHREDGLKVIYNYTHEWWTPDYAKNVRREEREEHARVTSNWSHVQVPKDPPRETQQPEKHEKRRGRHF